jgi:small-conductance mechanosensitive channel
VDKINTITTTTYTTGTATAYSRTSCPLHLVLTHCLTDGRNFQIFNTYFNGKICNYTRSRPYTIQFSIEVEVGTPTDKIILFRDAIFRYCQNDPKVS